MIYEGCKVGDVYDAIEVAPEKPGATIREAGNASSKMKRTGRGLEVFEPPLCAVCLVDGEVDERSKDDLTQDGLNRVELHDGGVTRARISLKETQVHDEGHLSSRKVPTIVHEDTMDGTPGRQSVHDSPSAIWISIQDPINGKTFQPSPMKPIPSFMLSSPISGTNETSRSGTEDALGRSNAVEIFADSTRTDSQTRPNETVEDKDEDDVQGYPLHRGFSNIAEEPLKRPSTRRDVHSQDDIIKRPATTCPTVRSPSPHFFTTLSHLGYQSPPQSCEYLERYNPVISPNHRPSMTSGEESRTRLGSPTPPGRDTNDSSRDDGQVLGRKEAMAKKDSSRRGVGAEIRRLFTGR